MQPLAKAEVRTGSTGEPDAVSTSAPAAITDANGSFVIAVTPSATWPTQVCISAPGFTTAKADLAIGRPWNCGLARPTIGGRRAGGVPQDLDVLQEAEVRAGSRQELALEIPRRHLRGRQAIATVAAAAETGPPAGTERPRCAP